MKRSADPAVKKGSLIQTAKQFYDWGCDRDDKQTGMLNFILVEKTEIQEAAAEMKVQGATLIPGTLKIHSVVAVDSDLYTRETACSKPCCWENGTFKLTCKPGLDG